MPEQLVVIQRLLTWDTYIKIPFVCVRCGKCCREIGVRPLSSDVHRIAECLGIAERSFIDQYLGKIVSVDVYSDGDDTLYEKQWRPCPLLFFNTCSIYSDRPRWCRYFPGEMNTDGELGIGCPGIKQMRRVISAVGRGIPCIPVTDIPNGKKLDQRRWPRIWRKFMLANPTKEMIEAFAKVNNISREQDNESWEQDNE